jgi:hypothetical protein
MTQEQEPSLVVWVKNQDGWSQVQAHVLNSLWQREGSRSLCNLLLQDVFRLSDGESIDSSDGLAGMYQNNNEPRNYVLAIELPRSHMGKVAGGLAGGAALALGGLFAHKNKQAIMEFLSGKTVKNAESGQRIVEGLRTGLAPKTVDLTRENLEIFPADKAVEPKSPPNTQGMFQAELTAQEESKLDAGSLNELSLAQPHVEFVRLSADMMREKLVLSPKVTLLEILTSNKAAQSKSATQGMLQAGFAESKAGTLNAQTLAPQDVEFAIMAASEKHPSSKKSQKMQFMCKLPTTQNGITIFGKH